MKLSAPQKYFIQSPKSINLFLAGMGTGKTYIGGIISFHFIERFPEVRGFIGANTYDQLNTSTLFRIKTVWKELFNKIEGRDYVCGKKPPEHFNTENHFFDSYSNIISFHNGAVIFQGSLERTKAHEGKEFGWAILDETKDTAEQDVKEIILMRLRQPGIVINGKQICPLYILTSPAKVQWINDWFKLNEDESGIKSTIFSPTEFYHKEFDNKCVVIASTYHNIGNLPANYIEDKKFDLSNDQFARMIYGDPFMKTGGEFYSSFDRQIHVGKVPYVPGLPIHMTVDQNVVPYYTALLIQVQTINDRYQVRVFREYCLPNPNNKTEKVCQRVEHDWEEQLKEGFFFYGDATGRNRDTRGENDYEILQKTLWKYIDSRSNRVLHNNPGVPRRREFMNRIMEGKLPIDFIIDTSCKETIGDMEYLKELPDGTKWKEKGKDDNGVSFEKRGHTSDSLEYFFCSCFKSYFKD